MNKEVFLVFYESGSYEDYGFDCEKVFSTIEKAINYVKHFGYTKRVNNVWHDPNYYDDEPRCYHIEIWKIE